MSTSNMIPTRPLDREKVKAVIKADQLIHGYLIQPIRLDSNLDPLPFGQACESPGYCAVGSLLFAAGMSNGEIRMLPNDPDDFRDPELKLLYNTYGVAREGLMYMASGNDEIAGQTDEDRTRRQELVFKIIDGLPDETPFQPSRFDPNRFDEDYD